MKEITSVSRLCYIKAGISPAVEEGQIFNVAIIHKADNGQMSQSYSQICPFQNEAHWISLRQRPVACEVSGKKCPECYKRRSPTHY